MSESFEPVVRYTCEDGVARVTLNRPGERNALTSEVSAALLDAFERASDPAVRVVVLTGAGTAFCSGSDLKNNFGAGALPAEQNLRVWRHPVVLSMRALAKPIICAVNGPAAGIGVGIALAGDLIAARQSAVLHLAFTRLGLVPDGGTSWFLSQSIGRARALRYALLGEPIDARTAEALGLVSHVFADAEFDIGVDALAERLARGPTRAYALLKELVDAAPASPLATQLELEARLQASAARSQDFAEGLGAFLDKRAAAFTGR